MTSSPTMPPTATTRGPAGPRGQNGSATAPRVAPLPTRQRRPGYVALAVLLIVGLAAVGAWAYAQAGQKTPIVVVVREVPAGQVVERADLSTVDVAGGVTAVAGSNLDSVLGQVAAVDLLPNMLLQRSMVSTESPLQQGEAMVGLVVRGGTVPADGVEPGDTVAVLQVPTANAGGDDAPKAQVLVPKARVRAARPDPAQAGGTLLTVVVPAAEYAAVAAASSTGQAAVVLVAP